MNSEQGNRVGQRCFRAQRASRARTRVTGTCSQVPAAWCVSWRPYWSCAWLLACREPSPPRGKGRSAVEVLLEQRLHYDRAHVAVTDGPLVVLLKAEPAYEPDQ
jgi:hypothetical protein